MHVALSVEQRDVMGHLAAHASLRLGHPVRADEDVVVEEDAPFVLDRFTLRSKSKNTPFDGQRMEGKVLATFVGGSQVFGKEG